MKTLHVYITFIFLLLTSNLYAINRIVYVCFDPDTARAYALADQLKSWHEEGDIFLYIQGRSEKFKLIEKKNENENDNDFKEEVDYLRSTGIRRIKPLKEDVLTMGDELSTILNEYVDYSGDQISIKGENDEDFALEIVLTSNIYRKTESMVLLKRFIEINDLEKREVPITFWSLEEDMMNTENIQQ